MEEGLLPALVNEVAMRTQAQGADFCAGLEPPLPQCTRSLLLGKMLLLFQADNRPFPCKSLHAPMQTYPQRVSAQQMPSLKGQTHRPALFLAKGKPSCLSLKKVTLHLPQLCLGSRQIPARH